MCGYVGRDVEAKEATRAAVNAHDTGKHESDRATIDERMLQLFRAFDRDGDNTISPEEVIEGRRG